MKEVPEQARKEPPGRGWGTVDRERGESDSSDEGALRPQGERLLQPDGRGDSERSSQGWGLPLPRRAWGSPHSKVRIWPRTRGPQGFGIYLRR
jgi:hypothetical protein